MDIVGGVHLVDGSKASIGSGLDDYSRFVVSAAVVARATARPVCDALARAMRAHGVPEQILTDNGKVITNRFGPGTGEVLFDRICRENGIDHILTKPRSPTTTGKVERWHKTLRREFLNGKIFDSIADAQAQLDAWVEHYNHRRPHQGIGMVAPARRFALTDTPIEPEVVVDTSIDEPDPEAGPVGRAVSSRRMPGVPVLEGEALRAVEHRGSHMQIIAAASAGKTEVVSQRVADLLAGGVPPEGIVAFTFTERAAAELKARIEARVSARLWRKALDRLNGLFVGTIHAAFSATTN